MSSQVIWLPEAEADLAEAAAWYDEQREGLGDEFVHAVLRATGNLPTNPLITSRRSRGRNVRFTYPKRFPYRIIYEATERGVFVISVIHAARDDRHWRERLE
jgi:toxin ParE1/3/4